MKNMYLVALALLVGCSNVVDLGDPESTSSGGSAHRALGVSIVSETVSNVGNTNYNIQSQYSMPPDYVLTGIRAGTKDSVGVFALTLVGHKILANGTLEEQEMLFNTGTDGISGIEFRLDAPHGQVITGLGGTINKYSDFSTFRIYSRTYDPNTKSTYGAETVTTGGNPNYEYAWDRTPELEFSLTKGQDNIRSYSFLTGIGLTQKDRNLARIQYTVGSTQN